ncbi:MAG: uncharacterized protein KVP18_000826 [Porospora cf. gigantea A]|uniref:uncharacterized protein n=1 Tax=Porospora cf. gigantea A TaxID=2853593 RepID=UPI00355AC0D7|nr:MAG: hypothetical protein KVP18_000826 [Porospora cf. gigantea A]
MSQRYYDRVLSSSGVCSKSFNSDFGSGLLKKMGWKGQGLGKAQQGTTECVQNKRRAANTGLGAQTESAEDSSRRWNNWWDDVYNQAAANTRTSDDSSTDSESESVVENQRITRPFRTRDPRKLVRQKDREKRGLAAEESEKAPTEDTESSAKQKKRTHKEKKPEKAPTEDTESSAKRKKRTRKEKKPESRKETKPKGKETKPKVTKSSLYAISSSSSSSSHEKRRKKRRA